MINTRERKPLKSMNDDGEMMSQLCKLKFGLRSSSQKDCLYISHPMISHINMLTPWTKTTILAQMYYTLAIIIDYISIQLVAKLIQEPLDLYHLLISLGCSNKFGFNSGQRNTLMRPWSPWHCPQVKVIPKVDLLINKSLAISPAV